MKNIEEKIKTNLSLLLKDIFLDIGTNNPKIEILTIVDNYFKNLYTSNTISDYQYNIETYESDQSIKTILKGGPRTFWVNYSIKIPPNNNIINDDITVYVNGVIKMINSMKDFDGLIKNTGKTLQRTISTDKKDNSEIFPDFAGIYEK